MLFDELFDDIFSDFGMFTQQSPLYKSEKKCPVCGRTYSDFRRTGKFGCGECYNTFRAPAAEVIKSIHSNVIHTGKIPSKSGEKLKKKRAYEELKKQLQEAVKTEDYETAAKLHRQIREMEGELK